MAMVGLSCRRIPHNARSSLGPICSYRRPNASYRTGNKFVLHGITVRERSQNAYAQDSPTDVSKVIRKFYTKLDTNGNRITMPEGGYPKTGGIFGKRSAAFSETGYYRDQDSSVFSGRVEPITSTKSFFAAREWLKSVGHLNVTFRPSGPRDDYDHILMQHKASRVHAKLLTRALRDSCFCDKCRHPITKQRLVDSFSLPTQIIPESIDTTKDNLTIKWSDNHVSSYPREWLQAYLVPLTSSVLWPQRFRQWYNPNGNENPPSVEYERLKDGDSGLRDLANRIAEYGFCFVEGCPVDPNATRELLEKIAFIRVTHYGGFYDFTSDLSSKDTAYTNIALEPHNDNTYFSDPTGLQMLHLLSHTEGEGGLSTMVDGFRAAEKLQKLDEEGYKILSRLPINAHASGNADIGSITPTDRMHRVFESSSVGLSKIRWNNADRGTFPGRVLIDNLHAWYDAAAKFNNLVNSDEFMWKFQLEPGKPLIFDNWRMLHGRTAFTGKRRMAGGYINMDDFVAKWKQLNLGNEHVLKSL